MKTLLRMVAAALTAAPMLGASQIAFAQPYQSYGTYDPCHAEQRAAANRGAVAGGASGALLGSAVAGRGHRLGGALLGGAIGAVAGHQIAKQSVRCIAYPRRIAYRRANCRWVQETRHGRPHDFEICRAPDGVWRASGRV